MTAVSQAAGSTPARSYGGIIALIALGQVITSTDFCATSVALDSIASGLHAAPAILSWVVIVFSLTYSGFMILGGRTADLFGHRRMCIAGLALFGVGCVLSAAAPSIELLIAARTVEGLGGALLTPASFSLINVLLPEGPVRHRAFSVFGVTQGISFILGLYGGGALVTHFGWRAVFLLNLPAIVAAAVLAWRYVPEHDPQVARPRLDILGAVLITAGMGALMFALSAVSRAGFLSRDVLLPLAAGVALLAVLAWTQARMRHPLVPLSLFRTPNLVGANVVCIALIASGSSVFVLLNLFMQRVTHFTAQESGLGMLPYAVAVMVGGQLVGNAMARFRFQTSIVAGTVLAIGGTLLFCTTSGESGSYLHALLPGMIAIGFGATAASLAVMALSTASVAQGDQGLASAVLMTCQQMGVSIGVSIVFAVVAMAAAQGASPATAFHQAFLVAAGIGTLGIVITLLTTRSAPPVRPL